LNEREINMMIKCLEKIAEELHILNQYLSESNKNLIEIRKELKEIAKRILGVEDTISVLPVHG